MSSNASRWVILFAGVLYILVAVPWRYAGPDGQAWRTAINSDGEGYYAYLTGIFIQGDIAKANAARDHFTPAGDGRVIQYYCGTALLQAPFFLVALAYSTITGTVDADALGFPFQLAIGCAALFYLLIGLSRVRWLLREMAFSEPVVVISLLVIVFGTGLFYHGLVTPGMSHAYGFAMVAVCMCEALRAWNGGRYGTQRLAAALALMMLVRPTHALLILALPLVTVGSARTVMHWLRSQGVWVLVGSGAIGAMILGLQPLLWYLQCGLWWVDPYAGEGFVWSRPQFFSVLFGGRKGLFFYWPLLLLALPGFILVVRRYPRVGVSLLGWAVLVVYVTSAWWSWYYGHGYGMRALLDILPVLAVCIAFALQALGKQQLRILVAAIVPFMLLQLFQTWQYQTGIIHPFNMDREKYAMIFLRSGEEWRNRFGWSNMAPPYAPHGSTLMIDTTFTANGSTFVLDGDHAFSPTLIIPAADLPEGRPLFTEVTFRRKAQDPGASNTVQLVYSLSKAGKNRVYDAFPMNDILLLDDRTWRSWRHAFNIPAPEDGDELGIYLWQTEPAAVTIKDFHIRVHGVDAQPQ
jgi:hypothetical protein